jgi:hypothetical protein
MTKKIAFPYLILGAFALISFPLLGQKSKTTVSKKGPSVKAFSDFYPKNTKLNRTSEQNMHTSMVNMGENIEMDAVSTSYTLQHILKVEADSQTIITKPYKIDGYIVNNGIKQDISQNDSNTELKYVVDAKGRLINITGNEDYIKAMKMSGINNAQSGLNLMVYFKHNQELFLNDSFQIDYKGNPYSFNKTFTLTDINDTEATFTTHTRIVLDQNYDMNDYDIHQRVEGTSKGMMKVRLSDYLVTYNEENLDLAGYMEMVTVNIPLTIKGSMKELVTNSLQ